MSENSGRAARWRDVPPANPFGGPGPSGSGAPRLTRKQEPAVSGLAGSSFPGGTGRESARSSLIPLAFLSRSEVSIPIARRAFMARLAGSAFSCLLPPAAVTAWEKAGSEAKPKVSRVATMTGPVRCDSLGTTLMHEHLLWFGGPSLQDSGYTPIPADKRQESVDFAVSLLNEAARVGINTLVDLTPHRPIDLYQQIAQRSPIWIVPSTGFYRRAKSPSYLATMEDPNQMYEYMLKEVVEGIQGTKIRAGIIKVAAETSPMTDWEKKVFRAAARVQQATGTPIATHDGAGAREQFDCLVQAGAMPRRFFISHVDMVLHGGLTREQLAKELISIARDGGYLEFDTFGQESYTPWRDLVYLWQAIMEAGFVNRMFFSMDCNWRWENGKKIFEGADAPNADPDASRRTYAYMMTDAVPRLLKSGFSEDVIHTILVENPRRFFCGE
jgi:phosphotriesterase-related protein